MSLDIDNFHLRFKALANVIGIGEELIFDLFEKHNHCLPEMGLEFFQIMEQAILENQTIFKSEAIRNHYLWLFYLDYAEFIKEERHESNHKQLKLSFNYKTLAYVYSDSTSPLYFELNSVDPNYNRCCEYCDSKQKKGLTAQQAIDAYLIVKDNCTRKSGCQCYISITNTK